MVRRRAHKKGRRNSLPHTGAWYWRPKVNRLSRRKHWRSFAALIGDPFMVLCSGRELDPKKQKISPRVFLQTCWSTKALLPSARKKDAFVLICLGHSNIFWPTNAVA